MQLSRPNRHIQIQVQIPTPGQSQGPTPAQKVIALHQSARNRKLDQRLGVAILRPRLRPAPLRALNTGTIRPPSLLPSLPPRVHHALLRRAALRIAARARLRRPTSGRVGQLSAPAGLPTRRSGLPPVPRPLQPRAARARLPLIAAHQQRSARGIRRTSAHLRRVVLTRSREVAAPRHSVRVPAQAVRHLAADQAARATTQRPIATRRVRVLPNARIDAPPRRRRNQPAR